MSKTKPLEVSKSSPLLTLREILEGIRSQDGHSYIAHPHGKYRPLLKQIDHGWQDWTSGAATGLELWSYMFDWASTFHYTRFLRYFRNPDAYLNGPDPETVSKWDELCQRRRVVAFGGVDAHARKYPILPWVVFPYRQLFETIRTHLITEEPLDREPDQGVAEVLTALSNGNCFLARDNLADASGTRFQTACGGLQMGDEAIYEEPIELTVALPTTAEIHLLLDGKTVQTALATSMTHTAERPGVYRVEARLDDQPWLFTNPIYLRKPSVDGKHS